MLKAVSLQPRNLWWIPRDATTAEATDDVPTVLGHECWGCHCVMETLWKPAIVIVSNHKGIFSSLRMFYNPKLNTLTALMAKIKTRPLSKGYFFHSYRVNWKGGPSSVLLRQKTHGTHLQAPHWKPLFNSRALSHSTLVQNTLKSFIFISFVAIKIMYSYNFNRRLSLY